MKNEPERVKDAKAKSTELTLTYETGRHCNKCNNERQGTILKPYRFKVIYG